VETQHQVHIPKSDTYLIKILSVSSRNGICREIVYKTR